MVTIALLLQMVVRSMEEDFVPWANVMSSSGSGGGGGMSSSGGISTVSPPDATTLAASQEVLKNFVDLGVSEEEASAAAAMLFLEKRRSGGTALTSPQVCALVPPSLPLSLSHNVTVPHILPLPVSPS